MFTIAKTWKQPQCLPTDDGLRVCGTYIHWNAAQREKSRSMPSVATWMRLEIIRTSLVAQTVKRLSTMWENQVQSPGWEDPLEKGMAIHSSTLAWKIPKTEEPCRLQSMGSQRAGHD